MRSKRSRNRRAHDAIHSLRNRYSAAKAGDPDAQAYIEQRAAELRKRHPDKRIELEFPSHDALIVDDSF